MHFFPTRAVSEAPSAFATSGYPGFQAARTPSSQGLPFGGADASPAFFSRSASHAIGTPSHALNPPLIGPPPGGFQFKVENLHEHGRAFSTDSRLAATPTPPRGGPWRQQQADVLTPRHAPPLPPTPAPTPAPASVPHGLPPSASMAVGPNVPPPLTAVKGRSGLVQRHQGATLGVSQQPIGATMQLDECIARCRSEVQAIAAECRSRRQKFSDPEFPASERAIFANGHSPSLGSITAQQPSWRRASEGALDAGRGAASGQQAEVIVPGALGCAHLLGALATMRVLGRDPRELIVWREPDVGVFGVRFFKDGEWMYEVLDDFLPLSAVSGQPACSMCVLGSGEPQDWLALLEKAYAKIHGSYEASTVGCEEEALEDVLGAGASCTKVSDFPIWGELWQHLQAKQKRGYALMAIRRRERAGDLLTTGLLSGQAYPCSRFEVVDGQTLVELHNPWSKGQWTGRWGPKSRELLQQRDCEQFKPNSSSCQPFWMSIQDFCQNFTEIVEARVVPATWQCSTVTFTDERPSYPLVSVPTTTQAIFVLTQADPRLRTQSETLVPIGLRVYRCRIVAPPQHITGAKQNVSSPFKNLELIAEKEISKTRSVTVEVAKLEPHCLYVASLSCASAAPAFCKLRILMSSQPRFRELSAPESSYFLKAETCAPHALEASDSFSSIDNSPENCYSVPTPVRNDPMRVPGMTKERELQSSVASSVSDGQGSRPGDLITSCEVPGVGSIKIPPFLQEMFDQCANVKC
eukprot:TRINITY_DN27175_c0_g1_i1.p1 TRINITY_DN27175_c0_g1~~TRINITY_DN27175_c0_g1_i1.p1  ORF type:complete len:751 (+),score=107.80 TRINITY_DN27175_c0_g1_i1:11-2263(+)